ncbi:MAG: alpha-1,2-fucosyltransferase [Niastella sp.]|nr:alpha-1,2-fucosyltransferase [Niastella sp.]
MLPKTGLGNKLLVWAKGMVFSKLNGLPLVTSAWWGLQWGALLRRENKSRLYMGYFKETSFAQRLLVKFQLLFYKNIGEPKVDLYENDNHTKTIFLFNKVITNEDLFGELRQHRELISGELYGMLTPRMHTQLAGYATPVVGVHIRRGDFKLGNQTTPLDYFMNAIKLIRQTRNEEMPVTIFTDADPSEISEILALPGITIAASKPDILDILLLSKSKIMILSKSSTFGYWAAFLSDALVVRPHYDWQEKLRDNNPSLNYQEIKWDFTNNKSVEDFKKAICRAKIN